MYRSQLWTMRPYAGMATSEETNQRFRFLLKSGQTGLSLAFDLPTQLGLDSDDPLAKYDVGKLGVAVDTLDDLERIFEGIQLDRISTSFTINSTAAIILAMYVLVGRKQGLRRRPSGERSRTTSSKSTWPGEPGSFPQAVHDPDRGHLRILHPERSPVQPRQRIRDAHVRVRANAVQSISLPFLNALAYIDEVLTRGCSIDQVAPLVVFHMAVGKEF